MPGAFFQNDSPVQKRQGHIAIGIVTLLFLTLAGRLYYLQLIGGEQYRQDSARNSVRTMTIEAPRGLIYDRHGTLLAGNRASYTIAVIPFEVADSTITHLGGILKMTPEEVRARIRDRQISPFKPVPIQRDASFEVVSCVEERRLSLPGVIVQIKPTRLYPLAHTASHLLGYVSEVTREQLERLKHAGYQRGDLIGKTGVEKTYEPFLRGKNGVQYIEVNARGQEIGPVEGVEPVMPVPGKTLYLSIDATVQMVAEQAMPDTLAGALVALDPRNGEVLAFVSKPNFDPNLFSTGISLAAWKALNEAPLLPLLNRAIRGLYPAGSTLKIVTGAAGIEEGLVREDRRFAPCIGGYRLGRRWARCWLAEGHGALDVIGAIQHSCDVYFYQLGLRIGLERWGHYARAFGLGASTGLDIGDELNGLVPDMAYYNEQENGGWTQGKMMNLAIGQGETLVTPLQMAVLIAAVANGGVLYRPHVIRCIESSQGHTLQEGVATVRDTLRLSQETLAVIRQALLQVVNAGTAGRARIKGVQVAGKTGTAENPHGGDHSWFIGYAPADNPTLAVAALLENAPHGAAVPIVRTVMEAHLFPDKTAQMASLRNPPALPE